MTEAIRPSELELHDNNYMHVHICHDHDIKPLWRAIINYNQGECSV